MVEWVPIMLFVLGWHPDRPGEIDLQRIEVIYATTEACEADGSKIAKRMTDAALKQSGATYEYRCMPVPNGDEYESAFNEWRGEGE